MEVAIIDAIIKISYHMNSLTSGFYLSKSYCDHRPIRNQNSSKKPNLQKHPKNNLRNDTYSLTPLYVEVAKLMVVQEKEGGLMHHKPRQKSTLCDKLRTPPEQK